VASKISSLLAELKRRKVGRVAGVYIVVGLGILGAAEVILDPLGLATLRPYIVILVLLGFPLALVLAWAYEVRPEEPKEAPPTDMFQESPRPSVSAGPSEGAERGGKETVDEERPAIAVLPFDDFSPNPEDAYFANGMHEEVLTQLQKIKGLAVRGRTSVLRYREEPKPLPEIAKELGVAFILEGSARKAGDQVRLTAQLIDARKDEHLWAENYDRPLSVENLISVQSDIAQQVAETVGVLLSPEEQTRIGRTPTLDLRAYDYYLVGRHHLHQWSLTHIEEGLASLRKSVETDPAFAQGHAGVAYAYSSLGAFGQPPEDTWPHARAAAERALAMDPSQAEAHNALALEAMSHRYDWSGAEAGFKRALEYNPSSVEALDWLGISLAGIWGRFDEAKAYCRQAKQADPMSLTVRYHLGIPHLWAREMEEASRVFEALEESGPAPFLRSMAGPTF